MCNEATGGPPMLLIYVIFIIVALYCAYNQSCPRMAATAAALRQIWSGGCQSCRNSEMSGLSGLHPSQGTEASAPGASYAREACVCDVCPCAAIDVVVRSASPVTHVFEDAVTVLNHVYCHILASVTETYGICSRVFECRTACQHQAQIVDESQYNALENFNFCERKSSGTSRKSGLGSREDNVNRSTSSTRQQGSPKVKTQSSLHLYEKVKSSSAVAKLATAVSKDKKTSSKTKATASKLATDEIEPTIVVRRTSKIATKDKGVSMCNDEESLGTEEKGVGVCPDAERLSSRSREGSSLLPDRSWHRKPQGLILRDDETKSTSPVESQAYCDRCKERGTLCLPSCPNNPHSKK